MKLNCEESGGEEKKIIITNVRNCWEINKINNNNFFLKTTLNYVEGILLGVSHDLCTVKGRGGYFKRSHFKWSEISIQELPP